MIILNIINFFKGYVKILIVGKHAERFINLCAKRNIYIWNIKRTKDGFEAFVSVVAYKLIDDIAVSSDTEVTELKRGGFGELMKKISGRSGLIAGFIIAIFLFLWMTGRVWYIEIAPSNIPEETLREQLKISGLDIGVPIKSIDTKRIQAQMMNLNPQIEWIWTEKKGTMIFVDLRERVERPETIDINEPCNLVATHAGRVTFAMITEGRAMVTVGQNVSKGQLLAGGMLGSNVVGARGVHSQGTVMADVFINMSGDYLLTGQEESFTGREDKSYSICFGSKEIKLPSKDKKFLQKKDSSQKIPLKIGDIYFPVSVIKNVSRETITTEVNYTREQVVSDAEKYLDGLLQKEVAGGIIIEKYFFNEDIDENTVRVRLEALCNMEISQTQPIEEGDRGGQNS